MGGAVAAASAIASRNIVADLGLGASYSATESGAATSVILTIKTDGTWEITFGSGDTPGGSPTTGTWLFSGGTASDFEVLFAPSNQVGSPTINNGAAAYTAISVNRSVEVTKTGADASADIATTIRKIAVPTQNVTDTSNFAANGAP